MPLSVLLLLGLVGLALYLRGAQAERAAQLAADPDAAPLAELARSGSDLARPHDVEFFLFLPTEDAAGRVAEVLRRRGFATEVSREDPEDDWLCLARQSFPPTAQRLAELRGELTALAEAEAGVYDGWGTTVVPHAPEA